MVGAAAGLGAAGVVLASLGTLGTWRAVASAGLLALVAAACLARHRREARGALLALPVALALVPTLSWPLAALAAGLGTLAAALSLPAQGRSLAAAGVVVGLLVAGVAAAALALDALADAATPLVWAPVATLVLLPLLVVTTRRFLAPEATA